MIPCLAAVLALTLVALVVVARSRARVARLLAKERSDRHAFALAARVELPRALSAEIAALLAPLRASMMALDEQAETRAAALAALRDHVGSLRVHVGSLREAARDLPGTMGEMREMTNEFRSLTASLAGMLAVMDGSVDPRTVHRPRRAAPSVAPPGSATMLPPEPAQVAAGLGPRPTSRPLPPGSTPHPPPVRVTRRAATLLGIATSAPPSLPSPPSSGAVESDAWSRVERPSDVDGERTRVAPRPPPEALGLPPRRALGTSPTLPSMVAVTAGRDERGDAS